MKEALEKAIKLSISKAQARRLTSYEAQMKKSKPKLTTGVGAKAHNPTVSAKSAPKSNKD